MPMLERRALAPNIKAASPGADFEAGEWIGWLATFCKRSKSFEKVKKIGNIMTELKASYTLDYKQFLAEENHDKKWPCELMGASTQKEGLLLEPDRLTFHGTAE